MADQIFNLLNAAVNQTAAWFQTILDSSGMFPYVIGMVVIAIFWRLIISPLFGGSSIWSSGSDSVASVGEIVNPNATNSDSVKNSVDYYPVKKGPDAYK